MPGKVLIAAVVSVALCAHPATSPYAPALVIAVMTIALTMECVRIVPRQHAWIVERLGRFHAVLPSGLGFLAPFIDRVAFKHPLAETTLALPEHVLTLKDDTPVSVMVSISCRIVDPKLASYACADWRQCMAQLALAALRSELAGVDPARLGECREAIGGKLAQTLDAGGRAWGVGVSRCEVTTPVSTPFARGLLQ